MIGGNPLAESSMPSNERNAKQDFPSNHDFVASPLLTQTVPDTSFSQLLRRELCRFVRRIKEVHLKGPKPILLLPEVLWAA
jgi:hypothetical protein